MIVQEKMPESDTEEETSISSSGSGNNVVMKEPPQDIVVKVELSSPPLSPVAGDEFMDVSNGAPESADQNIVRPEQHPAASEYILGDSDRSCTSVVKSENFPAPEVKKQRSRRIVSNKCFAMMESLLSGSFRKEGNSSLKDESNTTNNIPENKSNIIPLIKPIKPFKCVKCCKSYCTERQLWAHPCDPGSLECDVCGEKMPDISSLQDHQTNVRCGACKECGKEFIEATALKAHMLLAHAEGASYKCSLCKISFNRVFSLTNHIKKVHSKKSFECDVCGKVLPDEKSLESHQEENTCAKCVDCGKVFLDLSKFRAHRLSAHTAGAPLECEICKALFRTVSSLNSHRRKDHTSNMHDCMTCGKKCPDMESLRAHQSDHACIKCYDCGKEYVNVSALKAHRLLTHIEGAAHKCPMCPTSFEKPNGLICHIRRVHNEKNPYICSFCGHKCSSRPKLKSHLRTHKVRPFPCDQCSLRFTSKSGLLTHQRRLHEKERPYVCTQCNKSFAVQYFLQNHIKYVHNPERELKWQARLQSMSNCEMQTGTE